MMGATHVSMGLSMMDELVKDPRGQAVVYIVGQVSLNLDKDDIQIVVIIFGSDIMKQLKLPFYKVPPRVCEIYNFIMTQTGNYFLRSWQWDFVTYCHYNFGAKYKHELKSDGSIGDFILSGGEYDEGEEYKDEAIGITLQTKRF